MDKYRIDSHKLMYHVPRVNDWLVGKGVYPIYMESSPSGACNHRCVFCALDFMEYKPRFLDAEIFLKRIAELGELGLKSMMYGGEGEPLLHKRIADFVRQAKRCGIDNAFTTNGVLLKKELAEQILPLTEWIKVSFNAGTRETYAAVHRTKSEDFDTTVRNLQAAAELKRSRLWQCTLGMQMILLPENRHEAVTLAGLARDIGLNYLVIKPYSQHPLSKTDKYKNVNYINDLELAEELQQFNTDGYSVIFRVRAMAKWDEAQHPYNRCMGLPFWSYIDAGGNVWGCSMFLGDERFLYGNINENAFQEIWEGERRRKSLEWVQKELDPCNCRVNCRMDEINRYLWELRNPPEHVNFI
ncbi:MAG: radical SAM protein [Planctomycetes bacterium]|nr:radical SAM protein [Planctomycetota bacterium]